MTERSANDTTTPARLVLDAYIIDPVTKLPMAPGVASGGATEAKQNDEIAKLDELIAEVGDSSPVAVSTETAVLKINGVDVVPKFAVISASSSGDNSIVAAVPGKKIRVMAYNLMGAGAVNARFQTGASGAYLTGLKYIAAAGGGICAPFIDTGWFETAAGDALNLELSAAVGVGGELVYIEV